MLLVRTKLGLSKINGIGLFADQFIPKGTRIWEFTDGFDIKVDQADLDVLSEPAREQFLKYSYLSKWSNQYVLCFDDARFYNHSEEPNVLNIDGVDGDEGQDIANRDIQEGEELTCDYRTFDIECASKIHLY